MVSDQKMFNKIAYNKFKCTLSFDRILQPDFLPKSYIHCFQKMKVNLVSLQAKMLRLSIKFWTNVITVTSTSLSMSSCGLHLLTKHYGLIFGKKLVS